MCGVNGVVRISESGKCRRSRWQWQSFVVQACGNDNNVWRLRQTLKQMVSTTAWSLSLILAGHSLLVAANSPATRSSGSLETAQLAVVAPRLELTVAPGGMRIDTLRVFDESLLPVGA